MADTSQLLYLEPDDEITSVVRRLREADAGRVVLVASGRSKVTTSAVALRLLAGVAAEDGREIALVADASGRSLAGEADIPAFASVAEANADGARPAEPPPVPRAPIHVVRGEAAKPSPAAAAQMAASEMPASEMPAPQMAASQPSATPPRSPRPGPGDETQAVPIPHPAPAPTRAPAPRSRRSPAARVWPPRNRVAIAVMVAAVLLAGALLIAVAPAATIVITPVSFRIDPVSYTLAMTPAGSDAGELTADVQGTATGEFRDPTPAVGEVTFLNYNTSQVRVAAGTQVAAGAVVFQTVDEVVVPTGFFTIPGTASTGVTAVEPGPAGNLPADAIDAVLDAAVRNALRAFSDNPNRIVRNEEETAGGELNAEPEITQDDVNAAVADIQADLAAQLLERLGQDPQLVYGPVEAGDPVVEIPDDLVGRRGEETFSLSGSLTYRRGYLERDAVEQAAVNRLLDDPLAVPEGTRVMADSVSVELGQVTRSGEQLSVQVSLRADATPVVDVGTVRAAVAGMTGPQAAEALQSLGDVSVELWPGWVSRVPDLSWRIEVRVSGEPDAGPSADPSAGASP